MTKEEAERLFPGEDPPAAVLEHLGVPGRLSPAEIALAANLRGAFGPEIPMNIDYVRSFEKKIAFDGCCFSVADIDVENSPSVSFSVKVRPETFGERWARAIRNQSALLLRKIGDFLEAP